MSSPNSSKISLENDFRLADSIEEKPRSTISAPSHVETPNPESVTTSWLQRNMLHIHLTLVFAIEAAFIILATTCLVNPIPLNIPFTSNSADLSRVLTTILLIWQSLAGLGSASIIADAFSREWSARLARITPGATDRVSTITSGFLDRIMHIYKKQASGTFKLAFAASLCFAVLTKLAPVMITIGAPINVSVDIQIGNLVHEVSVVSDLEAVVFLSLIKTSRRAGYILELEQIENTPFGLKGTPNWIIPRPFGFIFGERTTSIEYNSDVVEYHYDCHWENFTFVRAANIETSDQLWISPLYPITVGLDNHTLIGGSSIYPITHSPRRTVNNVSTSAFLFLGGNDTFQNINGTSSTPFVIDLGTLPAVPVPPGFGVTAIPNSKEHAVGRLASLLVCSPRANLSGGRVSLSADGSLRVVGSGRPAIGNISPSAANMIFAEGLFSAVSFKASSANLTQVISPVAANLFMRNSSDDWVARQSITPLDLDSINKNMNAAMMSASKGFTDGYWSEMGSINGTYLLVNVPATRQELRLALVTSRRYFAAVIVLIVIDLVLLWALCQSALRQGRHLFNLNNVVKVLQVEEAGTGASASRGRKNDPPRA